MSYTLECETRADDRGRDPAADYLETIALLQEEISRLERDLQDRDRGPSDGTARDPDGAESIDAATVAARAEVARLEADLAAREETIGLLMDHLSRVEEAHAAGQAEWEQLAGWLAELERRVEGQDGDAISRLEERLAAQQRRADELRTRFEQERRDAEVQRRIHEAEIARLREAMTEDRAAGGEGEGKPVAACRGSEELEALRSENLRLRAASEQHAARLGEVLEERDELRRQFERIRDELRRVQLEHAATVAELEARLSRASQAHSEPAEGASTASAGQEMQMRFQALRQHLLEIHQREEAERRQKHLIPRLSRLWSRTGPR